jgi:peptidoglycan-associated lipoprotein
MLNRPVRNLVVIFVGATIIGAAGCAKPKVNVQVSKNRIQQGEDVRVNWTSKDSKEVTLNGEKVEKTGSKTFTPGSTTIYTAVAKRGSKEARDSKTVDVSGKAARPTISISAQPDAINRGSSTTLRWSSTNADQVNINDLGTVPGSGSRAISPAQSTTYTATATGPGGAESASTRVTVTEGGTEGESRPPRVDPGANTTIATIFGQKVRAIYFNYDKADLLPEAKETLRSAALWLTQGNFRSVAFRIEGNCDPRGTEEYNLGLGERRAQAARDFLASLGVDASRMATVSYGKERANGTSEGGPNSPPSWAHDRNDTFVYMSGGTLPNPEPAVLFLF